jgi:ferredoxin
VSGARNGGMDEAIPVTVLDGGTETTLRVSEGAVLRDALLDTGFDVYGRVSRRVNCGGRGLCGTCGVRVREGTPAPEQWHDAAAERWGYPRLSCQVRVTEPMTVELVEKVVWGQLLPD